MDKLDFNYKCTQHPENFLEYYVVTIETSFNFRFICS